MNVSPEQLTALVGGACLLIGAITRPAIQFIRGQGGRKRDERVMYLEELDQLIDGLKSKISDLETKIEDLIAENIRLREGYVECTTELRNLQEVVGDPARHHS